MSNIISKIKNSRIIFFNVFWNYLLYPILLVKIPRVITAPKNFLDLLYNSKNDHKTKTWLVKLKNKLLLKSPTDCLPAIIDSWVLEDYTKSNGFELKKNDVVLDLGANIGAFSLYAASKGARVYAFEPVLNSYKLLVENINRNGFKDRIKPFRIAVSDKNTTSKLYLNETTALGHSIIGVNKDKKKHYVEVATWSLATIFRKLKFKQIDFLKMDIEAAEYPLIYNTEKKYLKKVKRLAMEYHNFRDMPSDYCYAVLKNYLKNLGFKVRHGSPFYIFAENKAKC